MSCFFRKSKGWTLHLSGWEEDKGLLYEEHCLWWKVFLSQCLHLEVYLIVPNYPLDSVRWSTAVSGVWSSLNLQKENNLGHILYILISLTLGHVQKFWLPIVVYRLGCTKLILLLGLSLYSYMACVLAIQGPMQNFRPLASISSSGGHFL